MDGLKHEQHHRKRNERLCPSVRILGEHAVIGTDDQLGCNESPLFPSPENSNGSFFVSLWHASVRQAEFLPSHLRVARRVDLVTPHGRPPEGNEYKNEAANP